MLFPSMILAQATVPVDAAAQAATAARASVPVAPPQPAITAQDVAQYVDPQQVAAYLPAKPSESDAVLIFGDFFNVFEAAVIGSMFVIGMFLLARIIHAFMIHRSVRKAIEAKSGDAGALIEKLNKPYEMVGFGDKRAKTGDDRLALVLIAIGFAIVGFGLLLPETEARQLTAGSALFPLFVGIALLVSRRLQKRELAEEQAAAKG